MLWLWLSLMLFKAWLIAGPREVQCQTAFGKKRQNISVQARLLEPWSLEKDSLQAADSLAHHIVGVVCCRADFIYDCGCILTRSQNAQRLHWQHWDVSEKDLWFFKVQDMVLFREPLPCDQYVQHSKSQVYDVISADCAAELGLHVAELPNGRPQWLSQDPRLCFKFPPRFAYLLMHNPTWRDVCLPSPFIRGRFHVAEWKLDMMSHAFARAFQGLQSRPRPSPSPANQALFTLRDCQNLADDIRNVMCQLPEDKQEELIPWVMQLQNTCDQISGPKELSAKFHKMIDFVFLCDLLHDVSQAKEAIHRSMKLCLPASLHDVAEMHLNESRLFDKSEVSRFRLVFDVAFMMWQRAVSWITQAVQKQKVARYLMWDSSPQFRRDYEMIRLVSVPESELHFLYEATDCMAAMWLEGGRYDLEKDLDEQSVKDDSRGEEEEAALMQRARSVMRPHVLPAVLLGFGATSLPHKFHALAHAFRLEQFNGSALDSFCREIVSVTSDFGVEHMLGRVASVPISSTCQFFADTDEQSIQSVLKSLPNARPDPSEVIFEEPASARAVIDLPGELPNNPMDLSDDVGQDAFDLDLSNNPDLLESPNLDPVPIGVDDSDEPEREVDEIFEEVPEPPSIDFKDMLTFPGVHHVLDNAVNGMSGVMANYEELMPQAAKLCRFLRNSETRDILLERCFGGPVGLQFRKELREFRGNIYPGRWGTVAFSVPLLLSVEPALRWGWDKARYLQDANARTAAVTAIVEEVDQAMGSSFFWAWLRVVDMLVRAIRKTAARLEGCSCHWGLLRKSRNMANFPRAIRRRWMSCPMRGLRAAELSSGDLLFVAGIICDNSAVELLQRLPGDISAADRAALLAEFDAGRSHLCFYLALKLTALEEWPWKICGLGHLDTESAHDVLRQALATPHTDARLSALKGPLRPLCVRWLEGESLLADGMAPLLSLVASLRFIPINERPAEALHRQTKLHGRSRPCHSVALMSLKQRMPEIKALFEDRPQALHDMAHLCHEIRNNRLSVHAVGLQNHPTLQGLRGRNSHRHPLMAQVIYHADARTLYSIEAPELAMRPGAPPRAPAPNDGGDGGPGRENGDDRPEGDDDEAGFGAGDDDSDAASSTGAGELAAAVERHEGDTTGIARVLERQTAESKLLLHALMLSRLCGLMKDEDHFLSLPYPAKAMRTLATALRMGQQPGYQPGSDINFDAELGVRPPRGTELPIEATLAHKRELTAAARSTMFFKVVRSNPGSLKRNKVENEIGFKAADVVVAPHRLCCIQASQRRVAVEATSLQLPSRTRESMAGSSVIISFAALECEQLAELRVWETKAGVQCFIKADLLPESEKWSRDRQEAAGILLSELVETAAGVRDTFWRLAAERRELLRLFHGRGWVEKRQDSGLWVMTPAGKTAVDICFFLCKPEPVLEVRADVPLEDLSPWELALMLLRKGFQHVVEPRSKKDADFLPGGDAKKWYSAPNATTASKEYLRCLLRGDLQVPHWKPNGFYTALLAGEQYEPKPRPLQMYVCDEDDMEPSLPKPTRARRAQKAPRKRQPQSPAAALEQECSRSSDEDDAAAESRAVPVPRSAEPAARAANVNNSFAFGLNHVTQVFKNGVFDGFEMTCHHPDHKTGSQKCRKHVKAVTRSRTEAETLQMLKCWGAWGAKVATREKHANLWNKVVKAQQDGTLPETVDPVMSFTRASRDVAAKKRARR
ncbi:TNN [Symbiodinium sp. CCMP2456]|nr:TNN [Symbiodinium sp. CCMP2456]